MEEEKKTGAAKEEEQNVRKSKWDIRPYLAVGLTVVLVVVICIAIFFLIFRFQGLLESIRAVIRSLQAIIIGFVLAYLLNPVMMFFERVLNKRMYHGKNEKTIRQKKTIRGLSVTLALGIFLAIIAVLIRLILPELIRSIEELVFTMNEKVQSLTQWVDKILKQDSPLAGQLDLLIQNASEYLGTWLQKTFLSQSSDWITSVTTGVYNVVKTIFNVIVGLIISVYVLMTKETFIGQLRKIIYAIFRPKYGNVVVEVVRKADEVFGGFFIGKIIDSVIIGFICFGGLYILRMPYVVLVSVIVGVTNIIPFFGPYIGAIPSFILIFLVNPLQGLYFIIFILVLQQVDGNIIGPKILGNTTGLSPFWVIFAILLFGGRFGVPGMIFGVPVFALLYYIVKRIVEHILRIRKLPKGTVDYIRLNKVDTKTNTVEEMTEKEKNIIPREKNNRNRNKKNQK